MVFEGCRKMRQTTTMCYITLLCFSLISGLSTPTFITDAALESEVASHGRLLQATKPCSIDFKSQNYTIITGKCKGPDYKTKPCCSSFKEFACPFADAINDLSTDCAEVMFEYIDLAGGYPKGLFSSICRDGKEGLACPEEPSPPPTFKKHSKNSGNVNSHGWLWLMQILLIMMISASSFTVSM